MKKLSVITGLLVSISMSSSLLAEGSHPHSDDRDVMRVHRPNVDNATVNASHADRKKEAILDTRKMKSQIITDTKVTRKGYSKNTPLSGKVKDGSYHPIKVKRMGDH